MTSLNRITRPLFQTVVHIEGMDLAGKSTATANLACSHPSASVHHNALTDDNPIYELADDLRRRAGATSAVLGHLYVSAIKMDLDLIAPPVGPSIQDSTLLLRSLAFNQAIGAITIVKDLEDLIDCHPRFGASIVLTASLDARYERLDKRRREKPREIAADDLLIHTNPADFVAMETVLIDYATTHFNAIIIDTAGLTAADVFEQIDRIAVATWGT